MESFNRSRTPPGVFVRALYDYAADDPTNLSLRKGDIIQVLTQLDTGWWDGIIHGVRGWFPSNYCTLISSNIQRVDSRLDGGEELDYEPEFPEEYNDHEEEAHHVGGSRSEERGVAHAGQEEAAFWIPQATPDGRLFYFNTLTGDSTMELPLESPHTVREAGPRELGNAFAADHARPPAEMLAAGYERDEDTDDQSASEAEARSGYRGSGVSARSSSGYIIHTNLLQGRMRRSYPSDGASPATSMESLVEISSRPSSSSKSNANTTPKAGYPLRTNDSSFIGTPTARSRRPAQSQRHFTPSEPVTLTWDRIVDDMRRSMERYRQAVNRGESDHYVTRAEDVSDHLRLLLCAGSSTTDNHSGNPSIISSNKALYPHFRDMMSRFSKLVLSSHIAAADWSPGETRYKCLQEADGMLDAVYGYVEVARQQRGEEIPRLFPGFVDGQHIGGNWRGNAVHASQPLEASFTNLDEEEAFLEPNTPLSADTLERLSSLEVGISSAAQALEKGLYLNNDIITHKKHKRISDGICGACGIVIAAYEPWMTAVESINLSALNLRVQSQHLSYLDFHKQKIYTLIADLVHDCQVVAAPLADEWARDRGIPLDERLKRVRITMSELRTATSDAHGTLRALYESLPLASKSQHGLQLSSPQQAPPTTNRTIVTHALKMSDGGMPSPGMVFNAESPKIKKFFGEVPISSPVRDPQEDIPYFLRLDFEREVVYDEKGSIRGGTMTGLVEQLTRQDRFDTSFNNTFLLTYQSFTTAQELFELIIRRWNIQPPPGLDKDEYQLWVDKKQAPIRFRIVNVLKSWVNEFWMEGTDNKSKELIQRLYAFAKDTVANSGTPGARPLMIVVEQRMRGEETTSRRLVPNSSVDSPSPILPKNMKKLKLLDIDPLEFARQLTIIESRLYGKIKPPECLNKIWQKKTVSQDTEPAANVKSLILHSNRLTNWVAEMILMQQDIKKRVAVIKHFVTVAEVSKV